MNIQDLHRPFDPDKVSWRVGSTTKDKKRGLALAYLDARDVMERLDEVCGPENWQSDCYDAGDGRLACKLGIRINGEWVWKCAGAGGRDASDKGLSENDVSKASFSDALKRAAVLWGIGRYLYDLQTPWVNLDEYKKIIPAEHDKLRKVLMGAAVQDTGPSMTSKERFAELRDWIFRASDLDELDRWYSDPRTISEIDQLPARQRYDLQEDFLVQGSLIAESDAAATAFKKSWVNMWNQLPKDNQDNVRDRIVSGKQEAA
jgi:hypothetical protein